MKKIIIICTVLLLTLSLVACGAADNSAPGLPGGDGGSDGIVDTSVDRKIVYTVNIDLEAGDVEAVKQSVTAKNAELGGYVGSNSESYDDGKCISVRITYRVPTDKLDELVSSIEGQGGVERKSVYTTDITTAYVSAQAKKDALVEKKTLLEELLESDGITAGERVSVISEIAEVNSEILAIELQIKDYDSTVDYSTVHLYVTEPFDPLYVIIPLGVIAVAVGVTVTAILVAEKRKKARRNESA